MNTKKILLIVLCVLLVVVLIMGGIFAGRVGVLLQSLRGFGSGGGSGKTTEKPAQTQQSDPKPSDPNSTTPDVTQPSQPTGSEHHYELLETTPATCDTLGYDIMVCTDCGKQDIQNFVEPLGHDFGPGEIRDPTCTRYGYTKATCYRCGEVEEFDFYDPLGHDYQLLESVEPSCEVTGGDKYECTRCGHELIENEVPAPGHTDEVIAVLSQPSCSTDGVIQVQCAICGSIREIVTPATGHEYGPWTEEADRLTRTCLHCDTTNVAHKSDLIVTAADILPGETGQTVTVTVGTAAEPDIFQFVIEDYLNNGSLSYAMTADRGFVVTWLDGAGMQQEVVCGFFDADKVIIAEG